MLSYRLAQGIRALLAFTQAVDYPLAQSVLSSAQMQLFVRMSKSEQLHSLNVLRAVLAQGATPDDLAIAALLHDVGKSRYALNIVQRSLAVIVKKIAPKLEQRLSATENLDLLHVPFVVRRYHPLWSAHMLQGAEGSARAIWLVEHHADPLDQWQAHEYAPLLKRLKEADDSN